MFTCVFLSVTHYFLAFPACFYIPIFFSNLNSNCLLTLRAFIKGKSFLTFPACFYIPILFSNLNYNRSNLLDLKNLQTFCYQKLFCPFTVWIDYSSDLKFFEIPSIQSNSARSEQLLVAECFFNLFLETDEKHDPF